MRKKRILAIYNRITQIAQKGNYSYIEYYKYIDDVINNDEYTLLQDVFNINYGTDIRLYRNMTILKQQTWKIVLNNTNTSFMYRLKTYYDSKGVYQIGQSIYDNSNNEFLGKFIETNRIETVNFLGATYSMYKNYDLYRNTDLSIILNQPKEIIVKIEIGNTTKNVYLNNENMILLDKYKLGTQILINENPFFK